MSQLMKFQRNLKKMLFFWGCIPVFLSGQPPVTGLYDAHNQYVGGLPHGNWFLPTLVVDRDTVLMMKTVYDMGNVLSDTSYNFKTGKLIQTISYKNGLEDGISKEFWPDGRLRGEVSYTQGVVDGFVKSYSAGGELLTRLFYVNGEEDLNHTDRYLSDKIIYDTSYAGFNQPIWKYYAKYDTIIDAKYVTLMDTIPFLRDSSVQYYKNNTLYKEEKYNYQRRLYYMTTYKNRMIDTEYAFYTKKNYNGFKYIDYYQAGKLTKTVYYDTKGRVFKNQKYGERKALGRSAYRFLKKWRKEREKEGE